MCASEPGVYAHVGAWRGACAQCRSPAAGGECVLWWNGQRLRTRSADHILPEGGMKMYGPDAWQDDGAARESGRT